MMKQGLEIKTHVNKDNQEDTIRTDCLFELEESPTGKSDRFLVIKQSDKTKMAKENRREVGYEYDLDVTSDTLLCQKILENGSYNPTLENMIDFSEDLSRIIATSQTSDSRNAGTVIGMTIFGAVGFLALSFTIVGALAGGIIGVGMGRYAGKKVTKKMKRKKTFTNEELFRIKLRCLIKMGKIQQTEMKHNLNKYRIQLEKILQEFTFVFDLTLYEKPKRVAAILLKFQNFLLNATNQKAILLSYKLLKNYLKLVQNSKQEVENEIAAKVYSVFLPFKMGMEFKNKNDKKLNKITTYVKINAFLQKPEIKDILSKIPNPYTKPEFLKEFKEKLKTPADLEEKISKVLKWDRSKVQEALANIGENPETSFNRANSSTPIINRQTDNLNDSPPQADSNTKWKRDLGAKKRPSESIDDDTDEGVTVALQKKYDSAIKFKSKRLTTMSNYSPPLDGLKELSEIDAKHRTWSLPVQEHGLVRDNQIHNFMKSANASVVDPDSSDDSSVDDVEDEEERKQMLDDSYLFLKSQSKKPLDHAHNHELVQPMDRASKTRLEEIISKEKNGVIDLEIRGRPSVESKRSNMRPSSERRNQRTGEKAESNLVKMNSDPDIDDPKLNLQNNNSFAEELHNSRKSEDKIGLQSASKNQIKDIVIESKQLEIKGENSKKPIDTKQEIIFQKLMSISSDTISKWETIKNDKELKVFKIKPENSDVVLIKAWAYLHDVTPKQVFTCIYDTAIRAKWDTVMHNPHTVEKIDDTYDIFYFCIKAPFAVSNRDFVQKRCVQYDYPEKGDIIISFQSTTHPKAPPIKGNVRGDTHIAGYIIKPAKNGKDAELHLITQVDVKGAIPKMVVNFVAGRAPADWINKLKKACVTYGK